MGRKIAHHGVKHIIHGVGNIASGILFSAPGLSTYLVLKYWGNDSIPYWNYYPRCYDTTNFQDKSFIY